MAIKLLIASEILDAMRKKGQFRTEGFSLRPGFAGKYTITGVRPFKTRNSDEEDAFTVVAEGPSGVANIPGFTFVNARIMKDDKVKAKSIKEGENVFFQDEIEEELSNSVIYNTMIDNEDDHIFKKEFKVVGASVFRDETTKKPLIALRRYKHYNPVLRHHRAIMQDDAAFMTRDEFKSYVAAEGDARPEGIPADYNEIALNAGLDADNMGLWSHTLLITDIK